jgi:thiamine-monophosphate kinase
VAQLDEFSLIRALTDNRQSAAFLGACGVRVGVGDDAAVAETTPGRELVLSCDTMVEDVHFKRVTMRDSDIGFKAMASNISDMAAMGAVPRLALVALSVPAAMPLERLKALYDGIYECAGRYRVAVVGGDTTSTRGALTLTVTMTGEVEKGRALLRSAARPGQVVFVTGYPGMSAAGLELLLGLDCPSDRWPEFAPELAPLVEAHCRPLPQVEAGRLLLASGNCGALNDISDGLASEAWEIAEASGCGLLLDSRRIPVHGSLRAYAALTGKDPLDWMFYGGEDYQLIGTADRKGFASLSEALGKAGIPVREIGTVSGSFVGVRALDGGGRDVPLAKKGYNHFREVD